MEHGKELNIYKEDVQRYDGSTFVIPLTEEKLEAVKKFANVISVKRLPSDGYDFSVFPHDQRYEWNVDNYGPLYIPREGATVDISLENISMYKRIIDIYENNDFRIKDSVIYINGVPADTYTFKMNYYFMIGDNRHNSSDSRK